MGVDLSILIRILSFTYLFVGMRCVHYIYMFIVCEQGLLVNKDATEMEKELIHEVENKLVEIVGRSNVYVKASPIPEFDWIIS